jgi:hypothetical protein
MSVENRQDDDTLADWEGEGGRVAAANVSSDTPPWPWLPSGYTAQPCLGFRGLEGRLYYEFNRVYGPPDRLDARGRICQLDEGRSYWGITCNDSRGLPTTRRITYSQARTVLGSRLTFERFSSIQPMRDELPGLFQARDTLSGARR